VPARQRLNDIEAATILLVAALDETETCPLGEFLS
jgi:hypothetical protein